MAERSRIALAALLLSFSGNAQPVEGWSSDAVIATASAKLKEKRLSATLIRAADTALGPEGFRIARTATAYTIADYTIAANSPRGILYGAYALIDDPTPRTSIPHFATREWWSAAFQANFNLPLGGAFDRPIEEISAIVERTIHEAPKYGINTLQLMGRAGEGGIDISWFLSYDKYPKLRTRKLGWGIDRRIAEIRRLAAEAHKYGLDFLLWDHEIVFPTGLVEAYPELRGTNYPVCFSHPFVFEFLNAKIDEFFTKLPEVDGINLTFAETRGYNILEHGGCQCDRCRRTTPDEKVRRVVLAFHEACRRHGKRLEVRSYNQTPRDSAVMRRALAGLPREIPIVSKVTVVDFRGINYPDDPLLGAYPGQRQTIELTACPEGSGYGYIPALLGDFYKRKINRGGLDGVAIRSDYHLQYGHATFFTPGPPVLTFDTPNEFNIVVASRLAWDPATDVDSLWRDWTRRRYGARAADAEKALRRTAEIAEGIFFVKGFSLLTHLNMIPHLETVDQELDKSYLLEFFPGNTEYRRTHDRLKKPDEATMAEILAEKQRAIDAAEQSLRDVAGIPELERGFRTAVNAARLWKHIAEVYFRPSEQAINALTAEAKRIEARDGQVWPVYPAARGITAYEFAQEARERLR